MQGALQATWLLHAVHVYGHISQSKEGSGNGQMHACAHSMIQVASNIWRYLEGLSLLQRVPVRERQGNLAADQTAACIANVHTAKTGHGMLGRAAQLGLYCSEGVISATGPYSVKGSVKQLLTFVYLLRTQTS